MGEFEKKIQYWLSLADNNIDTARILLQNKKYLDAGFYCHQTIEKALKAFYWHAKNEEPPYTHNLIRLAEMSGLILKMDEAKKDTLDFLMPLNIEGRYPDELAFEVSRSDSLEITRIIESTKGLLIWIKAFLKN
jgi:HEPN domain-containing protein